MFLKLRPFVEDGLSDDDSVSSTDEPESCDHSRRPFRKRLLRECYDDERRNRIKQTVYDELDALVKLRLQSTSPFCVDEEPVWGCGSLAGPPTFTAATCQLEVGLSDSDREDARSDLNLEEDTESQEQPPGCRVKLKPRCVKSQKRLRLLQLTNGQRDAKTNVSDDEVKRRPRKSGNGQQPDGLADSSNGLRTIRHIFYVPLKVEPLTVSRSPATVQSALCKKSGLWSKRNVVFSVGESVDSLKCEAPVRSEQIGLCAPCLKFESMFESGNLKQAIRVGEFSYNLVLQPDARTHRHTQWYYFQVENAVPDITYQFTIINLRKHDSLYNHGLRPLFYSAIDARERSVGWIRTGHSIRYCRNYDCRSGSMSGDLVYYQLSWQMEFPHPDDVTYLAHCYPYTYTDLQRHITSIQSDGERSQFCRQEALCRTLGGRDCYLLTITDFSCHGDKQGVFVCGRVHPGESNSSWMIQGLVDFLLSTHEKAQELRRLFVFQVVPMLNPDGVVIGNYRCSLAATDLNRQYINPSEECFPTVYNAKQAVNSLKQQHNVLLFCDFHGHSRKHNVFMYGCQEKMSATPIQFLNHRLFPFLMANKTQGMFSFPGCKFRIAKCKESTARVVMWRQLNVMNSFTLEATFAGSTLERYTPRHFHCGDFMSVGQSFAECVLDYWQYVSKPFATSHFAKLIEQLSSLQSHPHPMQGHRCFTVDRSLPTLLEVSHTGSQTKGLPQTRGEVVDIDINEFLDDADIQWMLECESSSDSDSCSSSDGMDAARLAGHRQKRKKKRKKRRRKDKKVEKKVEKRGKTLPNVTTECNEKDKMERLPELDLKRLHVKQPTRTVKISVTAKPYKFVNPYANRSNGGIPIFSQERIEERAKKKLEKEEKARQEAELIRASQSQPFLPVHSLLGVSPSCHEPNSLQSNYQNSFSRLSGWQSLYWQDVRSHVTDTGLWSPWSMRSHTVGPGGWGNLNAQASFSKL